MCFSFYILANNFLRHSFLRAPDSNGSLSASHLSNTGKWLCSLSAGRIIKQYQQISVSANFSISMKWRAVSHSQGRHVALWYLSTLHRANSKEPLHFGGRPRHNVFPLEFCSVPLWLVNHWSQLWHVPPPSGALCLVLGLWGVNGLQGEPLMMGPSFPPFWMRHSFNGNNNATDFLMCVCKWVIWGSFFDILPSWSVLSKEVEALVFMLRD